jgi:mono/diheme cytochrome c family protein
MSADEFRGDFECPRDLAEHSGVTIPLWTIKIARAVCFGAEPEATMNDQNEDFENYLRQFRLRPSETRFILGRPANNGFPRWWVFGIGAGISAAAVAIWISARVSVPVPAPAPAIERPQPPATAIAAAPSALPSEPESSVVVPPPPRKRTPKVSPPLPKVAPAEVEVPQQQPPQTEGQKIFERACSACHSLDISAGLHFSTRAEYESYVRGKRPKGLGVSDEELPILVDYLFNRFGKK